LRPIERWSENELADAVVRGDPRALAKVISAIEDETPRGREILDLLYRHTGRAYRVGLTGPPGSGKSTLTDLLARQIRAGGETVAVLAVDPSSPFSGGAILGDRIRMQTAAADPGVFIRSMASRGSLGGLAAATEQAAEALDAAGFDWVLIETVGVGQSEMEVVGVADTTLLVLVPESGDGVQVMKAGLMEAGDIFVINKYDREGGDRIQKEIQLLLSVLHDRWPKDAWLPPIVPTVAIREQGGAELLAEIRRHRVTSDERSSLDRRRQRTREQVSVLVRARFGKETWERMDLDARIESELDRVIAREISPYRLAETWTNELAERLGGKRREA